MTGISLETDTRNALRDFASGLNLTYTETVKYLLSLALNDDESYINAGFRLRNDATKFTIAQLEEGDQDE